MSLEELEKRVKALEAAYDLTLGELNDAEDRAAWLEEALHALAKKAGFAIAPRVGEDDEEDE